MPLHILLLPDMVPEAGTAEEAGMVEEVGRAGEADILKGKKGKGISTSSDFTS